MQNRIILDALTALVLIVSAFYGIKKGVIMALGEIVRLVIAFAVALVAAEIFAEPFAKTIISPIFRDWLAKRAADLSSGTLVALSKGVTGPVEEILSRKIAYFIIFVAVFIVMSAAVFMALKLLDKIMRLPVLNIAHTVVSFAFGLCLGALYIFAIYWALCKFFPGVQTEGALLSAKSVNETFLLKETLAVINYALSYVHLEFLKI